MPTIVSTKLSEIKSAAIKSIWLYAGTDEFQTNLTNPNLQKETNFVFESITQKNDRGGAVTIGYKATITAYIISNSPDVRERLNTLSKRSDVNVCISIEGGSTSANKGEYWLGISHNKRVNFSVQEEIANNFIRFKITISAILRELPDFYTQNNTGT